jgi:putative DNA methylase
LFRRLLVPKQEELVATPFRHGGRERAEAFFMEGMSHAIAGIAEATTDVPAAIYYAFKQSEAAEDGVTSAGWASFLQAVVDNGLAVDGTWPIRSEMANRTVASGTNALASSIVLACRRREGSAAKITKADFLRRLRAEMPGALAKIRAAGVGPTDVPQAAIGPGIGIFTRYSAVLNPDGSAMLVRDALKLVNQVREELASEAQGDYDAPTRFAIDWFMAHGHKMGKAGDAILMANAVGLGLADLERAGIFKTGEGQAQLMSRDQLPSDWSPETDRYATAWEACQHLIKRLEAADGGVDAAAALFAELGELAEPAHQLAFRLYDICNNKGWAAEAQPYNNLIQEWDVIDERALAFAPGPPAQGEMAL